jgi:hypothetical protein
VLCNSSQVASQIKALDVTGDGKFSEADLKKLGDKNLDGFVSVKEYPGKDFKTVETKLQPAFGLKDPDGNDAIATNMIMNYQMKKEGALNNYKGMQSETERRENTGPWMFAGAVVIAAAIYAKDRREEAPKAAGFESMA